MPENNRERILTQALHLFARDGYEAVSVSSIAGALGITKGALYRHYPSKRAIFEAIVERVGCLDREASRACGVPEDRQDVSDAGYDSTDFAALRRFTLSQARFWMEDEFAVPLRRMLCLEQYRSEEMGALYQSMLVCGPVDYLADVFSGMMQAGRMRQAPPRALAAAYYAPMLLAICMSDGQTDVRENLALLERQVDQFIGEYAL